MRLGFRALGFRDDGDQGLGFQGLWGGVLGFGFKSWGFGFSLGPIGYRVSGVIRLITRVQGVGV